MNYIMKKFLKNAGEDLKDLSQQRRFNQQLLISRKKYLFNDDKSQFG